MNLGALITTSVPDEVKKEVDARFEFLTKAISAIEADLRENKGMKNAVIKYNGNLIGDYFKDKFQQRFLESIEHSVLSIESDNAYGKDFRQCYLTESHQCCGKAYMHGFNVTTPLTKPMLEIGKMLAAFAGYTFLGLTHLSSHVVTQEALQLGFKKSAEFTNKRSQNTLSDLYIIL